ncbi:MAG: hypothetical protein ASARMPREDX12_000613 [Alectoria sarmentosa]|nr:MAG: hypothetical protein ASARMPREDX12_000613 [Alectoria sarmentosa]
MELEACCALCGVPFDLYADLYRESEITDEDVAWTKYFIAPRKAKAAEKPSNDTWFLSGVGKNDESEGFQDLEKLGHIFAHSDLEERGRHLVPDWAGNYAGPEQFWDDGWSWNEAIDAYVVAGLLEEKPVTANVLDAKLQIEHYDIKSEDIVIGVFGETEVQDGSYGPYQNFGLLYVSDQQTSDIKGSRLIITEDKRVFDDHMNIETSWFPSAPTVRMGEPIGTQPNHEFYLFLRPKEGNQIIIAQANLDNSADGSKRKRKTVGFYAYVGGRGKGSHTQLYGETALVSWYTWLALWGRTIDTKVNFEQVSVEFYGEGPSKTFPQGFGTKIGEMFEFMGAYGCDGGDPACKRMEESSLTARSFSTTLSRKQINKILPSASAAIENMKGNTTLLAGGFGLCGVPDTLINTVHANPHIKGLTAVSNNAGIVGSGLGLLLESKQIAKMIASYVGENKLFEQQYLKGEIEMELTPQGTLAERCRAGGAGIPAFYTPAAFGTVVQTGELPLRHNADGSVQSYSQPRDVKVFNGKSYVMEEAIRGDYAFVKAWKADRLGNCMFRYAASNFNGAMGRNAKETIVEAEHIVEPGDIDPAAVHLPGIYVKKVIQSTTEKKIEKYNFSPDEGAGADMGALGKGETAGKRERIVRRAAKEFKSGMYANLGIGMPMLAPSFVDPSVSVTLQSENGILGLGPYPKKGQEDPDLINAGKETVTLLPGASCFGSDESFGMIRSGRIDLTILGAMQVSGKGDLANWMLPGKIKGFGGAMDLVSNPQETKVVVTMEHVDKKGRPKILKQCEFPLTGKACVSRIITDLCVFDVDFTAGLTLIELAEGVTVDEIRSKTEAEFQVADNLGSML